MTTVWWTRLAQDSCISGELHICVGHSAIDVESLNSIFGEMTAHTVLHITGYIYVVTLKVVELDAGSGSATQYLQVTVCNSLVSHFGARQRLTCAWQIHLEALPTPRCAPALPPPALSTLHSPSCTH